LTTGQNLTKVTRLICAFKFLVTMGECWRWWAQSFKQVFKERLAKDKNRGQQHCDVISTES